MSDQGTHYTSFIAAQLAVEYQRRESVNTRAAGALTSAAGLVTVTLAVFSVLLGKDAVLHSSAKLFVTLALIALLAAAVCAVTAGFPWRMKMADPEALEMMLSADHWGDSETTARAIAAHTDVQVIKSLRPGTQTKFYFLLATGICQIVAVAMLAACTLSVVFTK